MSTKPDKILVSALIGLGGNVGEVVPTMQRALDAIAARTDCTVVAVSQVYCTPPWGNTDQDWFLNACAEVETSLSPEALLDVLLQIEISEGRVRDVRWGPRTLDLDIIAYGNQKVETKRLTVPHARMGERAFVIVPLLDIASDRVIGDKSIRSIAANIDRSEIELSEEVLTI